MCYAEHKPRGNLEVTDTTPPSRVALPWRKKGEVSWSVPLLRAESRQEEAEVGLEATKNGCTPIAKVVVLPRSPDEALIVDVARGLNGCDVIKQADCILVKTASCVGDHGEKGNVKALVWFRVLNILGISTWLQVCRGPVAYATWLWYTFLCVRVHAGDIND